MNIPKLTAAFGEILAILDEIAAVSSRKKKEELIKQALLITGFKTVVTYAMDYTKVYGIEKLLDPEPRESAFNKILNISFLYKMLDELANAKGVSKEKNQQLSDLAYSIDGENSWELTRRILTKDLRCGVGLKTWKKYIPELPIHLPQVCGTLEYIENPDGSYDKDAWYLSVLAYVNKCSGWENVVASYKLDGARCWAIVEGASVTYLSRNGKPYPNFNCFDQELITLAKSIYPDKNIVVFDGEVKDSSGAFNDLMTNLRRLEEVDNSNFVFHVFDIVEEDLEFFHRILALQLSIPPLPSKIEYVSHLSLKGYNPDELLVLFKDALKRGHEGLVLKDINAKYLPDDRNAWMKIKQFHTLDLEVIGWEYGKSKGKNKDKVGALICKYKKGTVKVSGLSDFDRIDFMTNTPKIIEVK